MTDERRVISLEEQATAEAELAGQLMAAPDIDRRSLYGSVYDRVYEMHLSRVGSSVLEQTFGATPGLLGRLLRLSAPGECVLEVGCGAGYLATELARHRRHVVGVEVSEVILNQARRHAADVEGVEFRLTSGLVLPLPDETQDLVYSVQVFEHLHERDVEQHLQEVHRVLRPGGNYWILTPNRKFSASSSTCSSTPSRSPDVHLREWTYRELASLFRSTGFRRVRSPLRNNHFPGLPLFPVSLFCAIEVLIAPLSGQRKLASRTGVVTCSVVGTK